MLVQQRGAIAVLVLAAATAWLARDRQPAWARVPRRPWTSAAAVAAARVPVVLTGAPVEAWPALAQWRGDDGFAGALPPLLRGVVVRDGAGASGHAYWNSGLPLGALLAEPPSSMQRADMRPGELLRRVGAGGRLYWSAALGGGAEGAGGEVGGAGEAGGGVDAALRPRTFLLVDGAAAGNSSRLWLGAHGTATRTHYDTSHNFFAQLRGTKRFVLTPPAAHGALQLHPWAHPLSIFAQVAETALPPGSGSLVADLGPGDLLYIPPLHFHRTDAGPGLSVGVNVWSNSREGDVSGAIEEAPPDELFEDATPPARRRALLAALVADLADAVLLRAGARATVVEALRGRWRPHLAAFGCAPQPQALRCPPREELGAAACAALRRHAAHVAAAFRSLHALPGGAAAAELLLVNYVEDVAAAALGLAAPPPGSCHALPLFYFCLDA